MAGETTGKEGFSQDESKSLGKQGLEYVLKKVNETGVRAISKIVETKLATKVDIVEGKGLSTNDFDNDYKTKLDSIAEGAEVNVQGDWNQTTSTESDYILNKPAIKAGQGENSIIEGGGTTASGVGSHAEGVGTTASGSPSSHAEGSYTTASGMDSHSEGTGTTASEFASHVEGAYGTASGQMSHAEGNGTKASGFASHAEGGETTAGGENSHAEGRWTTAKNKSQHVFGEFNIADPSTALSNARGNYVEIVGNGTDDDARSNARTLDWSGNETLQGNLTIGGTITTTNGVKTTKITIEGINPADEYMYSEIIDASSDVALTRVIAGTSSTKTDGYVEILYKATTGVTCSTYIDSTDVALTADGAWHKLEQGCNPGHGVEIHVNNSSPVTGATLEVISKVYYI